MVYGIGEITYEELSPELQARIDSSSGGVSTVAGLMVIDGVFTKKVVATVEEQTEFEIPFDDYDSLNSHLDIKINSTWVNPERYSMVGNKIVLNDGVEIGTSVFFTLFHLAEPTGDGGFIEDVEMAETPQEIIVYDSGIIDEKVTAGITGHNVSGEAHADIREKINEKADKKATSIDASVDIFSLNEGHYMYEGEVPQGKNYPTQLTGFRHLTISVIGNKLTDENGYQVIQIFDAYSGHYENTKAWDSWSGWVQFATTINTSSLDDKIGVLNTERGYLTSVIANDANDIKQNGKYILTHTTLNKPDSGTDWYVCDATFEQAGTTGRLTATCYAGVNIGKTYTRINLHGTWYEWTELFSMGVYGSVTNLNDLSESGVYDIPPSTLNSPLGADYGKCLVFKNPDINAISQTAFKTSGSGTNILYIRQSYYVDGAKKWQDWQQVATTSKMDNLPLLNGWASAWSDDNRLSYAQVGNIVTVVGTLQAGGVTENTTIAMLPAPYRNLWFPVSDHLGYNHGTLALTYGGELRVRHNITQGYVYEVNFSYVV